MHKAKNVESLPILRQLALNLTKMETTQKRSMKSKLNRSLLSDEYRKLLIFNHVIRTRTK